MELTDHLKSGQILRALKIAMDDGNHLAEISDGWSKVQQVAHMEKSFPSQPGSASNSNYRRFATGTHRERPTIRQAKASSVTTKRLAYHSRNSKRHSIGARINS